MEECAYCLYGEYDREAGEYVCGAAMDEDEYGQLYESPYGRRQHCPCFRPGDEYTVVRHQN